MENEEEDFNYFVVINDEEQYSIWPEFKDIPAGWRAVGEAQSKADCLAYVKENWTDMRPKTLRDEMAKSQPG